jgi:predicted metal-dependent RNase
VRCDQRQDAPVGVAVTLPVRVLGDGLDVGRSCILLTLGHRNVLPDAGAHPAYADSARRLLDFASLPPLDAVLVTHFHLDHAGALPALYEFLAAAPPPLIMAAPTRSLAALMLADSGRPRPRAVSRRRSSTRPSPQASPPSQSSRQASPSTRRPARQTSQSQRARVEADLFTAVLRAIRARGKVLIPISALGRAHEPIAVLAALWADHDLSHVPVHVTAGLMAKASPVYEAHARD